MGGHPGSSLLQDSLLLRLWHDGVVAQRLLRWLLLRRRLRSRTSLVSRPLVRGSIALRWLMMLHPRRRAVLHSTPIRVLAECALARGTRLLLLLLLRVAWRLILAESARPWCPLLRHLPILLPLLLIRVLGHVLMAKGRLRLRELRCILTGEPVRSRVLVRRRTLLRRRRRGVLLSLLLVVAMEAWSWSTSVVLL